MTNAIKATDLNNVIVVDFATAAAPQSDYAKRLAAEAAAKIGQKGGIKAMEEGRSDIFRINPYLLAVEDDFNKRDFGHPDNQRHIVELSESIAEIGVKEELTVYMNKATGRLTLVDGECRLRAALRAIEVLGAEIKTVPVKMEDRFASEADRVLRQIVSNSGRTFSLVEKGRVFKKLLDLGWKVQDIAKKTGTTGTGVTDALLLNTLPKEAHDLIGSGAIMPSFALERLKANKNDVAKVLEDLKGAISNAAQQGKKKASAKHLGDAAVRRPSGDAARKEAAQIIRTKADVVEADGEATITMKAADFARIKELLGL